MKKKMKVSGRILTGILSVMAVCVGACPADTGSERSTGIVPGAGSLYASAEEAADGTLELWLSDYEQEIFQNAIDEFQENYPGVELNITTYSYAGSVVNAMHQMQTQLMGGNGPDLLLFSCYGMDDVYKLMKAGIFAPLNTLMGADASWDSEDYVMPVVEGGVFDGGQYVMPLTYRVTMALASEKQLEDVGFSVESCSDTLTFMKETAKLYDTDYTDRILEDVGFGQFPMLLGGDFLDYQTGAVGIDAQVLKEACEAYTSMYAETYDYAQIPENGYLGFGQNLAEGRSYLYVSSILYNTLAAAAGLSAADTPLLLPLRTLEGETTADIGRYAGIRANSKNQQNAWNMLRLMLKEDTQKNMAEKLAQLPVSKAALIETVNEYAQIAAEEAQNTLGGGELSEAFVEEYRDYVLEPDRCVFMTQVCLGDFHTYMEPFYQGDESYEDCIQRFEAYARIYLTE